MLSALAEGSTTKCADDVLRIINDPIEENTFNTLFVSSGKSINDLGNYEKCEGFKNNTN
jgi:hypothetical protein